jgi:hypothetical protein
MRLVSRLKIRLVACPLMCLALGWAGTALAANCNITSVSKTPINDLGANLYLGQFQGGLYPAGSNIVPALHSSAGAQHASNIVPRATSGAPDPNGRYVLLSIGMSNTTQEFSRFIQLASSNPNVNHGRLRIIDGAAGGQTSSTWDQPTDANYDRVRDNVLAPQGLTEAQVQAAWVKVANAGPTISLPNANADAFALQAQTGNIVRSLKVRYPNIQVVFLSTRIYAGYAQGVSTLNPEPYAYESAFGAKWAIQAQINQMSGGGIDPIAGNLDFNTIAPWIAWGPYLWADGLTPRSDGLTWACTDLVADGTHPSDTGRTKVADMLLDFLLHSPYSQPWFEGRPGDANGDGTVNIDDLTAVITHWGTCPAPCSACAGDVTFNCAVNIDDLVRVITNWG